MEYHKGFEHCSLVVYTSKMVFCCDLVGFLIAPQWREQWFSLDFFSGCSTLLVTDDGALHFFRPTKTFILRGASILGKGQDSYLELYSRLFHKLTGNLRDCYLDQPGYHEEFSLGILQHSSAGSETRVQLVIHILDLNSFGDHMWPLSPYVPKYPSLPFITCEDRCLKLERWFR